MFNDYMLSIMRACLVFFLAGACAGCIFSDKQKYLRELDSENEVVLLAAVDYFEWKKHEDAVPGLVRLLVDSYSPAVQAGAASALGAIKDPSAVEPLVGRLQSVDPVVVEAAVDALGRIGDPRAVLALVPLAGNPALAGTVAWALGNIGDQSAAPALMTLLNHDDKYVGHVARLALKRVGAGGRGWN